MADDGDYEDFVSEVEDEGGKPKRASTAGRKLMRWNPDVDQYVLLAVDIVCSEQGCPVPWNLVAEKINDYLTGEGIKQHLAKVRKFREQGGRSVPYKTFKSGKGPVSCYNPSINPQPQRTPKKKSSDGSDNEIFATGKGAGLLWTNPKQKKPQEPQNATELEQETKREVRGHKLIQSNKKGATQDSNTNTPKTPAKNSRKTAVKHDQNVVGKKKTTGKRGRAKKEGSIKDEDFDDEAYFQTGSPNKKQRSLRATYHVNYEEQPAEDEEDIFDARIGTSDEDAAYGSHGSQSNGAVKSQGSSKSSRNSATAPMQPPPDFDSMLHSRTGMHAHDENYTHQAHPSQYGAPFTGLSNAYGPSIFGEMPNMVSDQEFQIPRVFPQTADQLQMQAQRDAFGGYGAPTSDQGGRTRYGDPATPLSKKTKKSQDTTKGNFTRDGGRKHRKDSVMQVDDAVVSNLQQQAPPLHHDFYYTQPTNNDNYGNIPIANDTGRGISSYFGGQVNGGNFGDQTIGDVPNFSFPFNTSEYQQTQPLTASPTEMSGGFDNNSFSGGFDNNSFIGGLPAQDTSGNTGITPELNLFSFDTGNNNAMPSSNFDDIGPGAFGETADGVGGGFSSSGSGEVSTNGSQSDHAMDMSFDGGSGSGSTAGVGLGVGMDMAGGPWMQLMGGGGNGDMAMDMGLGGAGDDGDIFSLLHDQFQ